MFEVAVDEASPALRAVLGFLADHPRFVVSDIQINGKFDNGEQRSVLGKSIHNTGERAADDVAIADLAGDVWVFSGAGAMELVPGSASGAQAVAAFRKLLGPAAFVVA